MARAFGVLRLLYGARLLLSTSRGNWPLASGRKPPAWLVRILALRHALQGLVTLLRPSRRMMLMGSAVDGLHSASMLGLAAASVRLRRFAVIDSALAALWAILAVVLAAPSRRTRANPRTGG